MTHDRRHLLCNLFSILNSLSNLKIPVIWEEICTECSVAHTSSFPSLILNYESQTACGKMKTLMRLIVHLCNDKPNSKCSLESCCELMESEALEAEVFIILCFIFHGLSNRCLIGNFFCGYLAHCNNVNHSILMKLAVNFSSDWWHIFNELWKFGKYIAARSSNHGSNLQDRSWSLYLQDPDTGIIAHLDPHSLSYRIQTVLFCLIKLNPRDAVIVIENCIIGRQFPGLVLDLLFGLVNQEDYILSFLKRILLDSGQDTRFWMSNFLKLSSSSWYLDKLSQYFIKVTVNLTPRDPTIPLDDSRILTALILLRVLAAFRGFINYNFPPELSQKLLTLLTHRTIVSERGLQYISYSLAFLIGLRSSLATGISSDTSSNGSTLNRLPANTDIENIIVNWLQRLLDEQDIFNSLTQSSSSSYLLSYNQCPKTTSYIEPLLLLAILFHTNQPGPITELISSLLGLRIPSLGRTINGWRKLFFQTVFTENMIASQVTRIPITPKLNRHLVSHLPTQCMLQLLKSHAFAKNKLHTKKWIIGQIRESVRPVHPSLPELIEAHVTHSFSSNSNAVSSMNDVPTIIGTVSTPASSSTAYINLSLISEQELIIEFSNPKSSGFIQFCAPEVISKSKNDMSTLTTEQDFTPQLLFLYYAFYVFDYQFTSRLAANRSRLPDEPSCIYSNRLWDVIPITCLLQYARAHLSDYRSLYPKLLQLVTNHFPHLTMGEMMIQDELLLDSIWRSDHEPTRVISINIAEINISMNTTPSPPITIVTSRVMASHKRNVRQDLDYLLSFNEEQLNQAFNQVITKLSVSSMESSSNNLSEICSLWKNLIYMINQLIQSIEIFGLDCLLKYGPVIAEQCPRLLLLQGNEGFLSTNRKFIHSIELLWRRLHLIMPRRLELITMNRIRSNNTVTNLSSSTTSTMNPLDLLIEKANSLITKQKALSSLDLCTDPVENVMSEVDKKVFRCPSLLRLFLRILESSLLASRSYWAHRLVDRVQPTRGITVNSNTQFNTQSMPSPTTIMTSSTNLSNTNLTSSSSSVPSDLLSQDTSVSSASYPKLIGSPKLMTTSDLGQNTNISSTVALNTTTTTTVNSSLLSSAQMFGESRTNISPQVVTVNNEECERLCTNMLLTQDSAIVQLLLEYCLPTEDEKKIESEISILREIRIIICTFIHSLFIAQPILAEIIVWQTYPRALIPISAQAIPSLHICLDTVVDVFRMSGDYSKMVFCLDLVSHLAQHYNIQATLDRAAFMVDSLYHFLTVVVSVEERTSLLYECLSSLLRIGSAFPNLAPIIARLLLTVGLMISSTLTYESRSNLLCEFNTLKTNSYSEMNPIDSHMMKELTINELNQLCLIEIMSTLNKLVLQCSAQRHIYYSPELTN
ncbi:Integrator complex subunit 2 isoform 3 [Schistosoma japonicum]|uniref:Integrator complex subunit 2 isoform 3 n=3 Tax=Schistosoma japonicum TaxID=6182 RepID=A0A4Z2DAY7_SCHJA|nr:Integrator complex subunit 2 isoform 3 [Schistosoma japonicum]